MMSAIAELHGVFGPNQSLGHYPGGAATYFKFLKDVARARWLLLHTRDHDRATFVAARAAGLRVIMRVGEGGIVYTGEVLEAIEKGRGLVEIIQAGNEPYPPDGYSRGGAEGYWWDHAAYMNAIVDKCGAVALNAGIGFCTPAWRNPGSTDKFIGPPNPQAPQGTWMYEVRQAYNRFAYIGFHAYDPAALVNPDSHGNQPVLNRLDSWLMTFPQPVVVSEQGIAYKYPGGAATKEAGDLVKAERTFVWLHALAQRKRVIAGCVFISPGATHDWESFGAGGYDAEGQNSYVWTAGAWTRLGELVERSTLAAG